MIEMKKPDGKEYWAWKSKSVQLFFESANSWLPLKLKHAVFKEDKMFSSMMRDTLHGKDSAKYVVRTGDTRFKEYHFTAAVPISSVAKADAAIDDFIDKFDEVIKSKYFKHGYPASMTLSSKPKLVSVMLISGSSPR